MAEKKQPKAVIDTIKKHTAVGTTDDDNTLLDIHVGNPLKRITELLEEIKKQKAFSFTLKGSLGIMGVVLVFSLVGLFGTTHALCEKGVQSQLGTIRALTSADREEDSLFNKLKRINAFFVEIATGKEPEQRREVRTILITPENKTIHITKGRDVSLVPFRGQAVVATGPYNSCSQTLKIENQEEIEVY